MIADELLEPEQDEPRPGRQPSGLDKLDPWPVRTMAYDGRFDIPRWSWAEPAAD